MVKHPQPLVEIVATGRYLPERVLTNHDLEKMVDTSDDWIRTRSGIAERRISHVPNSDLAAVAARRAMAPVMRLKIRPWKGSSGYQYRSPQTPRGCQ